MEDRCRESLCEFFFPVFCFALYSFCRSRTFMRSLVSEPNVGLLLFDEPSASLDQHGQYSFRPCLFVCLFFFFIHTTDLFESFRQLRGNKTMVFSSHRFGNLTCHSDQILFVISRLTFPSKPILSRYMNDSVIVEEGNQDQLMKQNGEYARIWMLQARAFL